MATGGYTTCVNIGNILGVQLAALLIEVFNHHWGWLLIFCGILFGVASLLLLFFLRPDPELLGIRIEDERLERALVQGSMIVHKES